MHIKDIDLNNINITDDYIRSMVYTDIAANRSFFYVKIDKRNLEIYKTKDELIKHFSSVCVNFAYRYATICFSENYLSKTKISFGLIDLNHEIIDEKEDTVWLEMQFIFQFIYDDNNILIDFQHGINFLKMDFSPPLKITDELKAKYPELSSLTNGDFISKDSPLFKEYFDSVKSN